MEKNKNLNNKKTLLNSNSKKNLKSLKNNTNKNNINSRVPSPSGNVETHAGVGLSYIFGFMLIIGGVFSLPVGFIFMLAGYFLISNANKKVEGLK